MMVIQKGQSVVVATIVLILPTLLCPDFVVRNTFFLTAAAVTTKFLLLGHWFKYQIFYNYSAFMVALFFPFKPVLFV